MRYSVVAAAVIGAASAAMEGGGVSQLPDGQPQAPTSVVNPVVSSTEESPIQESTPTVDQTIYQTQTYTITSCAPEVTSCPAVVATSVIPFVSGTPVVVSQTDNSPVQESSAVVQSPAPSAPAVSEIPTPASPIPVITDNSPLGGGLATAAVCPTTCPAAITSYITVTVAPSGAASVPTGESTPATPGQGSESTPNQGSGAGTPGSSGSNSPAEGGSTTPSEGGSNSPIEGGAGSPGNNGGAAAPSGSAPISSVVDNSPVQPPYATTGPAVPQGTSPVNTVVGTASTGGVFPFQPTGAPIAPFTGSASTFSVSFVAAGLAAMAAIFFV